MIHELFPTVVGEYSLGREFTDKEKDAITSFDQMVHNVGNLNSVDKNVLDKRGLNTIKDTILSSVKRYISEVVDPSNKIEPYITQSWINYTSNNQWHHKHNHSNSFLSGVLYVKADMSVDRITFHDDKYNQINICPKHYTRLNSSSWDIAVKTGDIFIFPSNLTHEVKVSKNNQPRISLSFNTFIRGNIGDKDYMTSLHLK